MRRIDKDARALIEGRLERADVDISFNQWIALKVIRDGVVATAGDLSHELNITTGATTRMIDTMEESGWIARTRSGTDRRVVGLRLTDAGQATIDAVAPIVVGTWNDLITDFSRAEVDQFIALLTRLYNAAEAQLGKETRHLKDAAE
ncbi:MarR family winged helix-turn-helix transcriptional regulator [Sphingomonas immobilis]|uniref:MarR family transcriptional regulator n=1 Tax=Sphingomonas immobilis TaxID=3063997 RepID=A0ABT9A2Q7_9SPHN|nr:MarR family transcriptional regulator [Sphingomonas sp. CA1-15]MDO7844126.1 MarR family transcriptional regulator [Sphingomonas sp. CA1-15]